MASYKTLVLPVGIAISTFLLCSFLPSSCGYSRPNYGPHQMTQHAMAVFHNDLRNKRNVGEGVLDPYSVLGFLSFATFVFSILYNRQKMKPAKASGGGGGPSGPPMLNNAGYQALLDQDTIALLYKKFKNFKDKTSTKQQFADEYLDYDESFETDSAGQKHDDKKQSN